MEEAAKAIEKDLKPILPPEPHNLALSPTQRYHSIKEPPGAPIYRLEEQVIRELQYSTLLPDPDRGVLFARAYYDIRDEPPNANDATKRARADPSKPVTKLSLKDYKNKKNSDNVSPAKTRPPPGDSTAHAEKDTAPPKKLPEVAISNDMEKSRVSKTGVEYSRSDTSHRVSPSPEKKRRANDQDADHRPVKRAKGDDYVSSPAPSRSIKSEAPEKNDRIVSPEKKRAKELKPPSNATTNGRPASMKTEGRTSPRPNKLTNGTQKQLPVKDRATKKHESSSSNSKSSSVPPLLSPLRLDNLDMPEESRPSRPSPKKKPVESTASKPKKLPLDDDTPPKSKKRKLELPPLLSPTLPPIIEEELKRLGKPLPCSSPPPNSQKNSQIWDVPSDGAEKPVAAKKPAARASSQDSTIHVNAQPDYRKEEPNSCIVTLKYKKRSVKIVERILKLTPKDKKKTEPPKREDRPNRDDRSNRERSESVEPPSTATARKRPRTGPDTNASEAGKRPRASDILPPSTPLKQSSAMSRVASNSSVAGTPGTGSSSNLTPAPPAVQERRSVDPEKFHKQMGRVNRLKGVGRELKHQRDAIMRPRDGAKVRITDQAMASGVQSLMAYMLAFKLEGDLRDSAALWKGMMPWAMVVQNDCRSSAPFTALVGRLMGMFLNFQSRALCALTPSTETTKDLLRNSIDQQNAWQASDRARKSLGVYDGRQSSHDGGNTGKLIDRLGPWSAPEEAIPITIEFLRRNVDVKSGDRWKPHEELARVGAPATNGVS